MTNEHEVTNAGRVKFNYWSEVLEWGQAIVIAVILGLLIKMFVFALVLVDGPSMRPTMETGDRLLVVSRYITTPKKGDIVVFRPAYEGSKPYIKRVIADEGDTLDIDFETGEVFVNGQLIHEPYIAEKTKHRGDFVGPVTVPPGHVFVMGDNRNDSDDSRRSRVGMVDKKSIMGKATYRWWPMKKFGQLH